jgi:gluconate 2-dehydrogenase alpha chain
VATELKRTNVVIVGLGAAGGVACLPLASSGMDVIGLEAGSWLNTRDNAPDELKINRHAWPPAPQKVRGEGPTSRANASSPTRRVSHPMMNAIGGTTHHYNGLSWRLNPWDFKVRSETIKRYGASRIPKGSTVEDWPFGYEELEPYYDHVEYEIGISGKAGNIQGKIDPRGNVFEGPRQREYPMPPLRETGFTNKMAAAARALGWKPFRGPAAIATEPYDGRPGCAYHGYCLGAGCHVNAKSSTAVTTIPKAQKTGHFNVVTDARVTTIAVDKNGRVSGVNYLRNGQEYFQPADVVLMASHLYENVRLLLLCKSPAYPNGLSNNHDQVGKHYFSHNEIGAVSALFPFDLHNWYGTVSQGVAIDDWADDNFDHSGLDFIGGGNLWFAGERRPMASVDGLQTWLKGKRNWSSAWKSFVKENADRTNNAHVQKTTLPYEDNYLDLDPDVKDPFGVPVIRITAEFKENEKNIAIFTQGKIEQVYKEAGAIATERAAVDGPMPMGAAAHTYGATRMGDNPETNVVNRWGFSHEAPNLGILGGGVLGTSGAHNPTLTIQALAWRTAEYLVKNWKSISS